MKNTKIEAIVFDLAGTLIDFGSQAPSKVLIHIFNENGIPITKKKLLALWALKKSTYKSINLFKENKSTVEKKYKKNPVRMI